MTDVDIPGELLPDDPVVLGEVDIDAAIERADEVEAELLELRDEVDHDLKRIRQAREELRQFRERERDLP